MIKKSRSVTALELVVVIVIVGLLATITVPGFRKALLKSREKLAKANLQMILSAQKLYRVNNDSFWPGSGQESSLDEINRVLNLDIEDRYFNYTIEITNSGFEAEARSKANESISYTIDQSGFSDN